MSTIITRRLSRKFGPGIQIYTILQIIGYLVGLVFYGLLDINNPDGFTVVPSLYGLIAYILVAIIFTNILFFLLRTNSYLTPKVFSAHGLGFVALLIMAMIYYRLFWLPSGYVGQSLFSSDHFTYLSVADMLINKDSGFVNLLTGYVPINDLGYSLLIATLFSLFGSSSFFIIATNATLVSIAIICVTQMAAMSSDNQDRKRVQVTYGLWPIALLLIIPTTVLRTAIISKDGLIAFGIILALLAYLLSFEKRYILILVLLSFVIIAITRIEHAFVLIASFLIIALVGKVRVPRLLISAFLIAIFIVILGQLESLRLILKWNEGTSEYFARFYGKLSSPVRYESSKITYFLSHPLGDSIISRFVGAPFAVILAWIIPFPFLVYGPRSVLLIPMGLGNIIGLGYVYAAYRGLKYKYSSVREIFIQPIDKSVFITIVMFSLAVILSPVPMSRYIFPVVLLMGYFVVLHPRSTRNLLKGCLGGAIVMLLLHLIYHILKYHIFI